MTSTSGSDDGDPGIAGPRPGGEGHGLAVVDRHGLMAHIDNALTRPPVGVLLVEWDPVPGLRVGSPARAAYDPIAAAVLAGAGPGDVIVSGGPGLVALIRPAMTAPAEAEGLAHRIVAHFQPTGERIDDPTPTWAIGVAVSHCSDSGEALLRYAEHALSDAQLLGGNRVVPFDDLDRLLLAPGPSDLDGDSDRDGDSDGDRDRGWAD